MRLEPRRQARRVVDQARAAALAIGEAQHVAGDPVVDLLARRHPDAGDQALLRQHAPLAWRERVGRVAALVLEQVAQILVGRDPKQPVAT
jgi:hypothetical protein